MFKSCLVAVDFEFSVVFIQFQPPGTEGIHTFGHNSYHCRAQAVVCKKRFWDRGADTMLYAFVH